MAEVAPGSPAGGLRGSELDGNAGCWGRPLGEREEMESGKRGKEEEMGYSGDS